MLRRAGAFLLLIVFVAAAPARAAEPPYVLVDAASGQVLAERQSGELWYPASLAKLMTIYLLFEALAEGRLAADSPVAISEHALDVQPSRMGFPAGTIVTVDNALKMLIVKSANDIAVAVAEMMSVTEAAFVAQMNAAAARIGMISTRFTNPHGLPGPGQYSTARDLALLARTIWLGFPQYRDYFGIAEIRYGTTVMPAGNSLLEFYPGATGMKTGYICAAGYNLVATASRGGSELIAVVLGAANPIDRAVLGAALFDAGFDAPGSAGPNIAAFRPTSTVSTPANLRSTICPPGVGNGEEGLTVIRDQLIAALGPPIALPQPVAVFTGGADPNARLQVAIPHPRPRPADAPGALPAPAFADVPIPRPRPQLPL
jgi:D-alanyl-D-alanine carboxypeptidase